MKPIPKPQVTLAIPRKNSKVVVELKYVRLTATDRDGKIRTYLIPATSIAENYAAQAASEVYDSAYEDVYWSYFFMTYNDDKNIKSVLDRLSKEDMQWIIDNAVPYNTENDLTLDDIDRNWNSIKLSIEKRKILPFAEKSKHRQCETEEITEEPDPVEDPDKQGYVVVSHEDLTALIQLASKSQEDSETDTDAEEPEESEDPEPDAEEEAVPEISRGIYHVELTEEPLVFGKHGVV